MEKKTFFWTNTAVWCVSIGTGISSSLHGYLAAGPTIIQYSPGYHRSKERETASETYVEGCWAMVDVAIR
jgi:hypothetical protein